MCCGRISPPYYSALFGVLFCASVAWALFILAAETRDNGGRWWLTPIVSLAMVTCILVLRLAVLCSVRNRSETWRRDSRWNVRMLAHGVCCLLMDTYALALWASALVYYRLSENDNADHFLTLYHVLRQPSTVSVCITYALELLCTAVVCRVHQRALYKAVTARKLGLADYADRDAQGVAVAGEIIEETIDDNDVDNFRANDIAMRGLGNTYTRAPSVPVFNITTTTEDIEEPLSETGSSGTQYSAFVENHRSPATMAPVVRDQSRLFGSVRGGNSSSMLDDTDDTAVSSDAPLAGVPRYSERRARSRSRHSRKHRGATKDKTT